MLINMKSVLQLVFTLFSVLAMSQSITSAEYFFNNDPGVGNGNTLTTNGNTGELTQTFDISTETLSDGFHTLYLRTKNSDNAWSLYDRTPFYIKSFAQYTITKAEYFFETDPGVGNGNLLTTESNTGALSQSFTIPAGELSNGFHTVYIRTFNSNNAWSLYDKESFYISNFDSSIITAAEYFFNSDPGVGEGESLETDENTGELKQTFSIPTSDLPEGFHSFYLRTQNNEGNWSLYDRVLFYIKNFDFSPDEITNAEYFIDEDPGIGNGEQVTFSDTSETSQILNVSTEGVEIGEHFFYVRVQDSNGDWSIYDKAEFTIGVGLGLDDTLFKTTKILPNPFENNIEIQLKENVQISKINIYNNIGQTVYSSLKNMKNLELSNLQTGLYILSLETNLGKAAFKIVKK